MNSITIVHPSGAKTDKELEAFASGVNKLRSMGLSGRALLSTFGVFTWDEYQEGIARCKKAGIPVDDTEAFPDGKERILEVEVCYIPHPDPCWLGVMVMESIKFKALHQRRQLGRLGGLVTSMYKQFPHKELDMYIRDRVFSAPRPRTRPRTLVTVHILDDGSYDVVGIKCPDRPRSPVP